MVKIMYWMEYVYLDRRDFCRLNEHSERDGEGAEEAIGGFWVFVLFLFSSPIFM